MRQETLMGVLAGKVAVITGGTSGIGAAATRLFAAEGATVVVSGRRKDAGEQLAADLRSTTAGAPRRSSFVLTSPPRPTSKG